MGKRPLTFFLLFGLVILVAAVWLIITLPKSPPSKTSIGPEVCLGKNRYLVELAQTQTEREKGLMFKNFLAPNTGMLFIFPSNGNYPFWMKNTLIPLDIIWIDGAKRAVFIKNNAQPCGIGICQLIKPGVGARYVLEVNAGEADRIGAAIGDQLTIRY